jgi:hypothetical protein
VGVILLGGGRGGIGSYCKRRWLGIRDGSGQGLEASVELSRSCVD